MATRIEEMRVRAAAAAAAAKEAELTDEEREEVALLAQEQDAIEAAAEAQAARRSLDAAQRMAAARAKYPTALLAYVDLVALFPLGKSPPSAQLPGDGVIIIRNPAPAAVDALNRDIEAKQKGIAAILIDLLCSCTIDPDPMGAAGVTLRSFCETYPDAATQAAAKARDLGGAKSAQDKRGRS